MIKLKLLLSSVFNIFNMSEAEDLRPQARGHTKRSSKVKYFDSADWAMRGEQPKIPGINVPSSSDEQLSNQQFQGISQTQSDEASPLS